MKVQQLLDGVDRIGHPLAFHFKVGKGKMGIPGDSQRNHFLPLCCRGNDLVLFMRRQKRGNEQNMIQFQPAPDFLCCSKVAVMNGIKGSSENADLL